MKIASRQSDLTLCPDLACLTIAFPVIFTIRGSHVAFHDIHPSCYKPCLDLQLVLVSAMGNGKGGWSAGELVA